MPGSMSRALFRAVLPTYVRAGMGATEMVRVARGQGWGYRYQDMLGDVREYTGLFRQEANVSAHDPSKPLSRFNMVETDLSRRYKYRLMGEADYENKATGQIETRPMSLYSDNYTSFDDYERKYSEWYEESQYKAEEAVFAVRFKSVEHNKGLPY